MVVGQALLFARPVTPTNEKFKNLESNKFVKTETAIVQMLFMAIHRVIVRRNLTPDERDWMRITERLALAPR